MSTEIAKNKNKAIIIKVAEVKNSEVEINSNDSKKFHTFVQKFLKEIKEAKEDNKEENLDSTDSIIVTIKESVEEFIYIFETKSKISVFLKLER